MNSCATALALSTRRIANPDFPKSTGARIELSCLRILGQVHLQFSQRFLKAETHDPPRESGRFDERDLRKDGHGMNILQRSIGDKWTGAGGITRPNERVQQTGR
jgi:hypothetical protein